MSNPIDVQYAKKLRFLRKSHDKKQIELADFLEISQQAYSKIERAEIIFNDDLIDKLSKFFNISPADFELPLSDTINIVGNNVGGGSNVGGSNVHTLDPKLLSSMESMSQQNKYLYDKLLQEKDKRIELLENLLSTMKK